MKNYYILPILGISLCSILGFQRFNATSIELIHTSKKFSTGANAGYTGAPGESSCIACHSSSVLSGDAENIFEILDGGNPVSDYTPGATYDFTLDLMTPSVEKGFQITALDQNDEPAGVFIAGSNTELKEGTTGNIIGRKYVTHTSGLNAPSGWDWQWTAPATYVGEITFYVSTNRANGNNNAGGDQIYLAQYSLNSSAGLIEKTKTEQNFNVGFSPSSNSLFVNFEREDVGEMYINVVDLNGKSVFTQQLGKSIYGANKQEVKLPSTLSNGVHTVHFFVGNNVMAGKVIISK